MLLETIGSAPLDSGAAVFVDADADAAIAGAVVDAGGDPRLVSALPISRERVKRLVGRSGASDA